MGSRTTVDVMRHFTTMHSSAHIDADIQAVRSGETRRVRCYVKPDPGEIRSHWKPGYVEVSVDGAIWRGSSRKWSQLEMKPGQWFVRTRNVQPDEHVYKSWCVIECRREQKTHLLAVPQLDSQLCLFVLESRPS
jgi:hypothetical protein